MDNLTLHAVNEGRDNLLRALQLCGHEYAIGYKIMDNKFCPVWSNSNDYVPLPFRMNMEQLSDLIMGWLETEAEYAEGFDNCDDMSYSKGWEITTTAINNDWRMICVIEPRWAMYGK